MPNHEFPPQPIQPFELPSGLPEGPWTIVLCKVGGHYTSINGATIVDASGVKLVGLSNKADRPLEEKKAVARAVIDIPAMVEEIGRLRVPIPDLPDWRALSRDLTAALEQRNAENESLRALNDELTGEMTSVRDENEQLRQRCALNTELRGALKPFADAADAAERALCKHNTDEILIRLGRLREARAILAKCEAIAPEPRSAPPNRGPGLPAQDNLPSLRREELQRRVKRDE
jgi:hypothetical protein